MVDGQHHPTHWKGPSRWVVVGLVVGAFSVGAVVACRRWFRRVEVVGESMLPSFQAGDRLLIGPPVRVRAGLVVAVADPRAPERLMVKRVHSIGSGRVDVRGDNDDASTDSRQFGSVPAANVVGRVVYRYGPGRRVGWLPGQRP
jgi:nickel-type superoxide dismutase maturation protease